MEELIASSPIVALPVSTVFTAGTSALVGVMLSLGGLVPPNGHNNHRRSKSECGLDKERIQYIGSSHTNDNWPPSRPRTPVSDHPHHAHNHHHYGHFLDGAHFTSSGTKLAKSPSRSSIPEIFITTESVSGSDEGSGRGGGGGCGTGVRGGVSPVTRLAVFSLADFLDNISTEAGDLHACKGKKGSSSESSSVRAETALSSGVSNGSGELIETLTARLGVEPIGDENEPHTPNAFQRTREALDHLQAKIQKTKDLIKEEQKARDENVNEYLKLAANADRQQMTRIKTVFEKKNQKSAAYIQQLQKKLENYQKRQREIETHGVISAHRQPKEVLRDMGQGLKNVGGNIRDGITGFSGTVINKPKEIAHLIKNKFGSADNIKELASEDDRDEERTHHGSATLPPGTSLGSTFTSTTLHTSTNNPNTSTTTTTATYTSSHATTSTSYHHATNKIGSEEGSESNSSVTSESVPGAGSTTLGHLSSPRNNQQHMGSIDVGYYGLPTGMSLEQVVQEMYDRKEECGRLREEIETIKQTLTSEVKLLRECIGEERFKYERLEEQVNDLTELHQNEMENLKTTMTDMEEKVQYQSEERIRDLQEVLENCHTRISRMEHQQAQQQQYVTLEGLENSNARAIFVKLINVLLTILQVLLLVVATIANILTPLLQTRVRLITTATLLLFLIFLYVQWPEIRVLWERYRQFLPVN
ncbi:transmembrane and coiled-coil domains protein 1-like isoform X7 [Oratosquilla oratoria]|uniref:transmembrane and coiled-coil domains protein 1-like isoform X7 n=1 Tax=Oratosquilla oratoria TaxID=337810 RepID=UPI003F75EF65